MFRLGIAVLGVGLLWSASSSRYLNMVLTRVIKAALARWTELEVRDYVRLLELEKGYAISELEVNPSDWLCGRRLSELALAQEGVLVLGIRRAKGAYVGAPDGRTRVASKDVLTCYGPEGVLRRLSSRLPGAEGDAEHAAAVEKRLRIRRQETDI